jgi:hypothetical protein
VAAILGVGGRVIEGEEEGPMDSRFPMLLGETSVTQAGDDAL